jgi:hypothetical protein
MSGILRCICDRRPQRRYSFLTLGIMLLTHSPNTEFVEGITGVAGGVIFRVWPKVVGWGILLLLFSKEWTKEGYRGCDNDKSSLNAAKKVNIYK